MQRDQMFTFEITFLPASLPSLKTSYQRVRMAVGYPDGGISNNMALAFQPGAVLDAGGVGYHPDNATASWTVPAMPQAKRPYTNDALAFLTVRIGSERCLFLLTCLQNGMQNPFQVCAIIAM